MRFLLSALVSLLLISASAQADELRCDFQSRYAGRPGGCEPMPTEGDPTFVILRMDANQYGRCDAKSCDWFPLTTSRRGEFLDLDFSAGVQGAKMSQDGSLIIETISIMDMVIVSYGACQRLPS
jgi:hypothetical protein